MFHYPTDQVTIERIFGNQPELPCQMQMDIVLFVAIMFIAAGFAVTGNLQRSLPYRTPTL